METPAEIEFVGVTAVAGVREEIDRHIVQLETRFGRITACRVVVKAPGDHHRSGSPFEVAIHIALPAHKDVNVDHGSKANERSTDVRVAVNAAFKRATRQLQDRVRRMERMVKHHEPRTPSEG